MGLKYMKKRGQKKEEIFMECQDTLLLNINLWLQGPNWDNVVSVYSQFCVAVT